MNEFWEPPKNIREALTRVVANLELQRSVHMYLVCRLRHAFPGIPDDQSEVAIQESAVRLWTSNSEATFCSVFGTETQQPFAPYWGISAVNCHRDECRRLGRSRTTETQHELWYTEGASEPEIAPVRLQDLLHEQETQQFSEQARVRIDARRWNELVLLRNEQLDWLRFPYTLHPYVARAANETTQRADLSRARRVVTELLEADTTLSDLQRDVITAFFLNTYERS